MMRKYEPVDLIVAVGLCVIIFGGYLLFEAANGTLQAATLPPVPVEVEQPSGILAGMTWLQPALGQALVDTYLLERHASRTIADAVSELNRATMAHHVLQATSGGPLELVIRRAATGPSDHAAHVQTVMGRAIVNFTRRGIGTGMPVDDWYISEYNDRLIRLTEVMGQRLDQNFLSMRQANLGRAIVEAAQEQAWLASSIQERIGNAILHVAQAQTSSEEALAANQQQLASSVVAAVRTESLADRLAQLAAAEPKAGAAPVASTEPASWPEIPLGYLFAAVLGLVSVFCGGLSLASAGAEEEAVREAKSEEAELVYRKTA